MTMHAPEVLVYHGDALKITRSMPARSVDLCFTSPPYEAARTYGINFKHRGEAWVEWALPHFLEDLRVCRGLVAWVVQGQTRGYRWSAAPALLMAALHRRGVCLRNPPIFARVGIPGSGAKDWLRSDYEWIVCATATRGRLPWSDNTAMGHAPKWAPGGEMSHRLSDGSRRNQWGGCEKSNNCRRANGNRQPPGRPSHVFTTPASAGPFGKQQSSVGRRVDGSKKPPYFNGKSISRGLVAGDVVTSLSYFPPVKANPGNIIRCVVGGNQMGSKLAHENEAPFPSRLAEFFIRSFCPPGGSVLDRFSGSGTTVATALRLGRGGIAIDIRKSQADLTMRRLDEVLNGPSNAENKR